MKRGFTLIELIITIVILGVLAAIAIPGFSRSKEKNDVTQAVTYLRAIRLAEKMHFAKWGTFTCPAVSPGACVTATMESMGDAAAINGALGTEITAGAFTFSVAASAATFTATATRVSDGATISIDQAGTWSGTYAPLPTV
jgi:prepilin-type N-terminal cleavage/methylation domain-containing protein